MIPLFLLALVSAADATIIVALIGAIVAVVTLLAQRPVKRVVKETAKELKYEFNKNGGMSMRDALDRIEAGIKDIDGRVNALEVRESQTEQRLNAFQERMFQKCAFEGERLANIEVRLKEHHGD